MVLYSCITTYHLIEAMVHKLRFNYDADGILMISHWLRAKYEWYQKLQCFFDKVIVFNAEYKYSDTLCDDLREYFDKVFSENEVNLDGMEQIHVFGAEHSFGAYIFTQKILNYYWEEGAGALSKKSSMFELFKKAYGIDKAVFQYENHLGDGETEFVINRFYNSKYQLSMVEGDNLIDFDVISELSLLKKSELSEIITLFYGNEKIYADKNYALILTEHFANLSVMTWEEQLYLYKYLIDYFAQDYQLLFKPHPDDLMYYECEFENSSVIRKKFPAELLPFIFSQKPGMVLTSSSTSIYGMREMFDKCVEFDFKFSHTKEFYKFNRFFVALNVIAQHSTTQKVGLFGANEKIVNNFINSYCMNDVEYINLGDEFEIPYSGIKCFLVDEINQPEKKSYDICRFMKNADDEMMIIFLNSDQKYCFYNYEFKDVWHDIYPVEITLKPQSECGNKVCLSGPSIIEEKKEKIYIFCRKGRNFMYHFEKELPNVGITVKSESFDGKDLQIKILEGMLEATEKRLKYYINREKELIGESEV